MKLLFGVASAEYQKNKNIYEIVKRAIAIFDVTNKASFGVGFLANLCLAGQVPSLFLLSEDSRNGSIMTGLIHLCLERKIYNHRAVGTIVSSFLKGAVK